MLHMPITVAQVHHFINFSYRNNERYTVHSAVSATYGQSNLIKDRIAPVHESFNCLQHEKVSFKWFQN